MKITYLLNVRYNLKPETAEEFTELLKKMDIEKKTECEKGCISYRYGNVIKENTDGRCVLDLCELWENRESQEAHLQSEHMQEFGKIKNDYVISTEIERHEVYVPDIAMSQINRKYGESVNGIVTVPGSKSMTNRALLLAALSDGESVLNGVLFSDDSRHFLECLKDLGFELKIDEERKVVRINGTGGRIPKKTGKINVGSAGTAARFLTAMLALSDGEYEINCSKQMERRPMQPLFQALTDMGAEFEYLNNEGFLPVRVKGNGSVSEGLSKSFGEKVSKAVSKNEREHKGVHERENVQKKVSMDISKSTQFLSALLMVAPVIKSGLEIRITSEKKTGSYIHITMEMLKEFGVCVEFDGNAYYIEEGQKIKVGNYTIEPDVSAACYFYAAAALTGGSVTVRNVFKASMQGDMKFLNILEKLGCSVTETNKGIRVDGIENGIYNGIDIDMNDFSDQALTLAVLAAYAKTPTTIRNIGHIRGQECDRMQAIINELGKCGLTVNEDGNNLIISPGEVTGALIETYEDHRVAMAFTLLSLRTKGIIIDNPMCCKKTFENYYEVFEELLAGS